MSQPLEPPAMAYSSDEPATKAAQTTHGRDGRSLEHAMSNIVDDIQSDAEVHASASNGAKLPVCYCTGLAGHRHNRCAGFADMAFIKQIGDELSQMQAAGGC